MLEFTYLRYLPYPIFKPCGFSTLPSLAWTRSLRTLRIINSLLIFHGLLFWQLFAEDCVAPVVLVLNKGLERALPNHVFRG